MDYDKANGLADHLRLDIDEIMFRVRRDADEQEIRLVWKQFVERSFELYQALGLVKKRGTDKIIT